ncbi:FAD-dependent monooxygenase [Nakamurella leprariae]|uniref:FAD-dependent monooxygenase n=1 Tax=Nakamurella leprariae TaxID=2803911 RepID=A0A938YDA3_9ACTN|nr:FAD-dependent monooxygenase [Nakamurella leprariae]MBM9467488.1 FAD-dependent monooxygenase [Nakamurella leprariae]
MPTTESPSPTGSDPTSDDDGAPVLIVGAGPVGLVAACELARHGVTARVVEALDEPTTQSRAVGVQPRSQELFAALGILDRVAGLSLPQRHIEIDTRDGDGVRPLVRIDMQELPTRHPTILNLPQTATEAVLRERAAELGVRIERGVRLTGLTQDPDGVDVVLQSATGTERARYPWVVGADGGHSAVRGLAGSALQGEFRGSHFAMADVTVHSAFPTDVTRLFASPGGLTVMLCMAHGRTRLMFQVPDPGPDAGTGPSLELIAQLARDRMGAEVTVSDPSWLTYYSIHHAQVPQYRIGRVLLGGDAAHIHSPAGGQGMNTGMQDAANLAWKLALVSRAAAGAELLDSYHDERHPVGAAVVRKATVMADAMTLPGVRATARNAGMRLVGRLDAVTHALAENLAELTVGYRHSPIVRREDHRPRGALRAGDHAEDLVDLTDGHGVPVRIEDLLGRHPGHLLLVGTTDTELLGQLRDVLGELGVVLPLVATAQGAPEDAVVDAGGELARRYGIGERGMALVRPDGYLGYLAGRIDADGLADHLSQDLHVPLSISRV